MKFLEGGANAFAIGRIHLVKELELSLDDLLGNAFDVNLGTGRRGINRKAAIR